MVVVVVVVTVVVLVVFGGRGVMRSSVGQKIFFSNIIFAQNYDRSYEFFNRELLAVKHCTSSQKVNFHFGNWIICPNFNVRSVRIFFNFEAINTPSNEIKIEPGQGWAQRNRFSEGRFWLQFLHFSLDNVLLTVFHVRARSIFPSFVSRH